LAASQVTRELSACPNHVRATKEYHKTNVELDLCPTNCHCIALIDQTNSNTSTTMLDHGPVASHSSKSMIFLQIQATSGRVSYHEDMNGWTSSTINKLSSIVARGSALPIGATAQKALGTQTVSRSPTKAAPQPASATNKTISTHDIPSRSSSRLHGGNKSMNAQKDTSAPRQRKCKHFASIDGMLASTSDPVGDVTSTATSQSPARRSSSQHHTFPKRKRPSLSRPSVSSPSATSPPRAPRRTSTMPASLPTTHATTAPLPLSLPNPHELPFPTTTLSLPLDPRPSISSHHSASPPTSKRPLLLSPQPLSWTSDATRRREYAKIDAAYSGIRGFCRRILPGGCFRNGRRNFWGTLEGRDDGSDADSVRRYRLRLDGDGGSGSDDDVEDEKLGRSGRGDGALVRVRLGAERRNGTGRGLSCF
jgi:hypothetical protein